MKKMRSSRFLLLIALISAFSFSASQLFATDPLTVTAANVQMSADGQNHKTVRTAGATITPGQAVYLDVATGKEKLADANLATNSAYKVDGIAVTAATDNQPVVVCYQDAKFKSGAPHVIGDTIWLSPVAGGLTSTAASGVASGNYVSVMGVAVSTTEFNFKITRADAVTP